MWWHIQFGGPTESPQPSLHGGKGSSFPGLVPPSETIDLKSVLNIKPGDSGVVNGYQVDEITHMWSVDTLAHLYLITHLP